MTDRNTLIETLTNVIRAHRNVGLSSEIEAAAVLELVGPKPLVWCQAHSALWVNEEFYIKPNIVDDAPNQYRVCFDDGDVQGHYPTLEAAKAAAQAHADATHWANTKIGDVIWPTASKT